MDRLPLLTQWGEEEGDGDDLTEENGLIERPLKGRPKRARSRSSGSSGSSGSSAGGRGSFIKRTSSSSSDSGNAGGLLRSLSTTGGSATKKLTEKESSTIEYLFTGKLTLFPLAILFLGVGAGVLLRYGDKPYSGGYFESVEMYYGIAGLALAVLALGFFSALMLCIVLKISFTLNPDLFVVKKHGVFRSAKLEFAIDRTSLHYFRTHFSEEEAWLQLVIKEGSQFHQIFSWKGKGSQKDRFVKLFISLQRELVKWQAKSARYRLFPKKDFTSTEIISKKEVELISPFTHRLQLLADTQKMNQFFQAGTSAPLCIEDIPVINYDNFFRHFSGTKTAARESS